VKKMLLAASALTLFSGLALAQVRDWRDLELVHRHITESIHEMERARAANHYDMQGHGAKAEQLLREAQRELHEAIEAAKHEGHEHEGREHEKNH
jgi:F0F1-type ATP synthase membrane subunit b/b'